MKVLAALLVLLLASCASIPSMTDSCTKSGMQVYGECIEEPEIIKLLLNDLFWFNKIISFFNKPYSDLDPEKTQIFIYK